jgi:NADPH:quinone reductase
MRAALIRELGQPPELADVPDPEPGEGEVVVEIVAAPLNPLDVAVASGRHYAGHPPLPYVPGSEGIARTGDGLAWIFGSGVGLQRNGTLAERAAVPEQALHPVPAGADPALAGACGIAGLAGWLAVTWRAPVREGESVLVLGATGTVGLFAVQAARLHGAGRVVAAGRSEEGLRRAEAAGADATVRLDEPDLAAAFKQAAGGDGPNLVVDPLWGPPAVAALQAAAPSARFVQLGQSAGAEATVPSGAIRGKMLEIYGYTDFAVPRDVLEREHGRLLEAAGRGDVKIEIERIPLADAAAAWRRQAEGAHAKLVLVP